MRPSASVGCRINPVPSAQFVSVSGEEFEEGQLKLLSQFSARRDILEDARFAKCSGG
jgi:hypothetical protein